VHLEDILTWLLTGFIAGGFSGTLVPRHGRAGLLAVAGSGVCGALLGGWGWALLVDHGPSNFLGAVVLSVISSLAALYLLRYLHFDHPT
jgi:uncharacterized membrane protein YeaQ/YmgE (transglycosylase-associated protein family)